MILNVQTTSCPEEPEEWEILHGKHLWARRMAEASPSKNVYPLFPDASSNKQKRIKTKDIHIKFGKAWPNF